MAWWLLAAVMTCRAGCVQLQQEAGGRDWACKGGMQSQGGDVTVDMGIVDWCKV